MDDFSGRLVVGVIAGIVGAFATATLNYYKNIRLAEMNKKRDKLEEFLIGVGEVVGVHEIYYHKIFMIKKGLYKDHLEIQHLDLFYRNDCNKIITHINTLRNMYFYDSFDTEYKNFIIKSREQIELIAEEAKVKGLFSLVNVRNKFKDFSDIADVLMQACEEEAKHLTKDQKNIANRLREFIPLRIPG